jgi:hypothetical protein
MGCCKESANIYNFENSKATTLYLERMPEYNLNMNDMEPSPVYVFVTEQGWFDQQPSFRVDPWSVVTWDLPVFLEWDVFPHQGLPKPDAKSYPTCSWQVTQKLCRSKNSYCQPGARGYRCYCEDSYFGNPYSPDNDGCKG